MALDEQEEGVSPCVEAHVMTRSLVKFETMKLLLSLPPSCSVAQVRHFFSLTVKLLLERHSSCETSRGARSWTSPFARRRSAS